MGKLYTCEEVAERYRVKVGTVLAWIRDKKLCAISISGSKMYRIAEEDLIAFENARKTIPQKV
ncbi:MAG: helix-turn-helix domain-containing protein [Agathobaculum butyriciproducens]|nr:helix-turn-helix domain-containing protein [Agathobaculum butyriciproducens]